MALLKILTAKETKLVTAIIILFVFINDDICTYIQLLILFRLTTIMTSNYLDEMSGSGSFQDHFIIHIWMYIFIGYAVR